MMKPVNLFIFFGTAKSGFIGRLVLGQNEGNGKIPTVNWYEMKGYGVSDGGTWKWETVNNKVQLTLKSNYKEKGGAILEADYWGQTVPPSLPWFRNGVFPFFVVTPYQAKGPTFFWSTSVVLATER